MGGDSARVDRVNEDVLDDCEIPDESRQRPKEDGTFSLFAGIIKCGECGKALTIDCALPIIMSKFCSEMRLEIMSS